MPIDAATHCARHRHEIERLQVELARIEYAAVAARHYDLGEPPIQTRDALLAQTKRAIAALEQLIARSTDEVAARE